MEIDAPTFSSLNKPQKRALILRDQLRYTDARHLDTFIEGLSSDEPPTYKRVNGIVQPALTMVTLKDTATRFDLGNVHFDNDVSLGTGIYRTYLTVEDGRFELRTDDALPVDETNLSSVPIHVFIAKGMVPLFEAKFKAIWAKKNQINEIRQVAFNMSRQPTEQFQEGETLARLDSERRAQNRSLSQPKKSKKRRPGESVTKHASNKRKRVGLDTIPQDAKIAIFNTIPDQIKVNLFNNVVNTALPNFDNLMMASWNVVSVYSNVGTDFPELHKAIVELKSVLQDFEKGLVGNEPKLTRDFAPHSQDGEDRAKGSRSTPEPTQNGVDKPAPTPRSEVDITPQQQDEIDSFFNEPEHEYTANDKMPPPRLTQRPASDEDEERQPVNSKVDRRNSSILTHYTPELKLSREPSVENRLLEQSHREVMSPELRRRRQEYASSITTPTSDIEETSRKSVNNAATSTLRAQYAERKRKLITTFGGSQNVPQQYRVQMQKMMAEIKAKEHEEEVVKDRERERSEQEREEGKAGKFLKNSVLGGKKVDGNGGVPVALMAHMRKDDGGAGGVRRGH